jgi:Fe-S-cluster-containing hydrogenase component 2/bacterioferritin-associated ferredoxin
VPEVPEDWYQTGEILKSKPGNVFEEDLPEIEAGVIPILHCNQEIPCNPCSALCPQGLIVVDKEDIRSIPKFVGNNYCCKACEKCVAGCPGLAITLVDYRTNPDKPIISIPYEFSRETLNLADRVTILDTEGEELGEAEVLNIHSFKGNDRTLVVQVESSRELAQRIAGIKIQPASITQPMVQFVDHVADDTIICRCEHVTAGEIRSLIRQGYHDINEIKTVTRAAMGACGAKTCATLIRRLFAEEGVPPNQVIDPYKRPIFVEVPLGVFAGESGEEKSA